MELYGIRNQKKLRCGYTTGSCAAAAASAAVEYLLSGKVPKAVELITPKGIVLQLEIFSAQLKDGTATCSVRKDSGDDPDVTNGIVIWAAIIPAPHGIVIEGGKGVGKVTRPGLACAVGEAAINPGPCEQITRAMSKTAARYGYSGGFRVIIGAENGEQIARETFNARLGIKGGISILGTSGIVEPMSEQALIDTIKIELDSHWAAGEREILACPGNYGRDFTRNTLGVDLDKAVIVSNFIGEAIDYAVFKGFHSILLVGHAGKLIKLAAGVMQTHSAIADGRQEIFASHAALNGADSQTVARLMESITVDECINILQGVGILHSVLLGIDKKIQEHLVKRTHGVLRVEYIIFTNAYGELLRSKEATELLTQFGERNL